MLLFCRRSLFLGLAFFLQTEAQSDVKSCHECVGLGHAWSTSNFTRQCILAPRESKAELAYTLTTDTPGCEKLSDEDSKASDKFLNCSDCVKKREGNGIIERRWIIMTPPMGKESRCTTKPGADSFVEFYKKKKWEKPEIYSECGAVPLEYASEVLPKLPIERASCEECISSSKNFIWCIGPEAIFCMFNGFRADHQPPVKPCPKEGEGVTQCDTLGTAKRERQLKKYPNDCDGCVEAGGGWCVQKISAPTIRHCVPLKFRVHMCLPELLRDCSNLTAGDKKGTESLLSSLTSSSSSSGLSIFLILALVLTV